MKLLNSVVQVCVCSVQPWIQVISPLFCVRLFSGIIITHCMTVFCVTLRENYIGNLNISQLDFWNYKHRLILMHLNQFVCCCFFYISSIGPTYPLISHGIFHWYNTKYLGRKIVLFYSQQFIKATSVKRESLKHADTHSMIPQSHTHAHTTNPSRSVFQLMFTCSSVCVHVAHAALWLCRMLCFFFFPTV